MVPGFGHDRMNYPKILAVRQPLLHAIPEVSPKIVCALHAPIRKKERKKETKKGKETEKGKEGLNQRRAN